MGISVVAELVAGCRYLAGDSRKAAHIHSTLKESSPDILLCEVVEYAEGTFTGAVVEGKCDRAAAARSPVHRWTKKLRRFGDAAIRH